ncbi:MAG: GNAT family N-acetyltransferase [Pirellulales bacterium]|nr:GNAT family N-acetyltransferase [Pirellulales bacterium]
MPTIDQLRTARLIAERLGPQHLDDLLFVESDRGVRILLGEPVITRETVARRLASHVEHWQTHGYGSWLLREAGTRHVVGRCGLRSAVVQEEPHVELLYAIRHEFWRHGYTTEMSREVLRVGFEELGLEEIAAWTLWNNWGSRRVMEKSGLEYERDIIHARLPHVFYRLAATTWRERQHEQCATRRVGHVPRA